MKELDAETIETLEDVARVMALSESKMAIVYKHSPICGQSDRAIREMGIFAGELPADTALFYVDVIEARPASRKFEELTGIRHESPQALFIRDRRCVWSASHGAVKAGALREAAGRLIRPDTSRAAPSAGPVSRFPPLRSAEL